MATHCVSVQGAETFSVRCDIVTEPKRLHSANPLFATKISDTRTAIDARAQGRKAFSMQNGVLEAFSTAWRKNACTASVTKLATRHEQKSLTTVNGCRKVRKYGGAKKAGAEIATPKPGQGRASARRSEPVTRRRSPTLRCGCERGSFALTAMRNCVSSPPYLRGFAPPLTTTRRHSALGGISPAGYYEAWLAKQGAARRAA